MPETQIRTEKQLVKLANSGSVFIFKLKGNEGVVMLIDKEGQTTQHNITWSLVQRMRANFTVLPIMCYTLNAEKKEVSTQK